MVTFVPKLAAFAMAAFKVLPSIGKLTSRMNGIVFCRKCLTNLYQLTWDADQYEREMAEYAQKKGICDDELIDIKFAEKLQIRDVVWTYQNQKEPVLSGTELEIKKGEAVGLIGASGAGKTTSIARALYNEPEILVLDEATAALDNETETAVMESIDALQGQITMIIVAHRLTTIKNCDRIYEIVDGKAVERRKEEIFS